MQKAAEGGLDQEGKQTLFRSCPAVAAAATGCATATFASQQASQSAEQGEAAN